MDKEKALMIGGVIAQGVVLVGTILGAVISDKKTDMKLEKLVNEGFAKRGM